MKILEKELWFCTDCMLYAVNDDLSGLDYYLNEVESEERSKKIKEGLAKLPGYAVMTDEKDDFSDVPCACCGETLRGERFIFNLVGNDLLIVYACL